MSEHAGDSSEELAAWLREAGRRMWRPASVNATNEADQGTESIEQRVACLEELAGREFDSRDDIRNFVDELSMRGATAGRSYRRGQVLRDAVLLFGLLLAYAQYNFLDVHLQIARLPTITVFVPIAPAG